MSPPPNPVPTRCPRFLSYALAGVLLCLGAGTSAAVSRCEDRAGRVTYTNDTCPPDMKLVRRIDDSPPVRVLDGGARTGARDGEPAPPRAAAGLQPAAPNPSTNPEQEIRALDEARARQQQRCADLARRIDYATLDLRAAPAADRASAELALRRLQEEARATCPAPAARPSQPADAAVPPPVEG